MLSIGACGDYRHDFATIEIELAYVAKGVRLARLTRLTRVTLA